MVLCYWVATRLTVKVLIEPTVEPKGFVALSTGFYPWSRQISFKGTCPLFRPQDLSPLRYEKKKKKIEKKEKKAIEIFVNLD